MITRRTTLALALAGTAVLGACGDDRPITAPSVHVPVVAGVYSGYRPWTHQVYRVSDGFITSFACSGSITLTQAASSGGGAALTGFAVVGAPCPPLSFDLSGTVLSDGTIRFTTGGPKPPEGPCPNGTNVEYLGTLAGRTLSVRGVTSVQCPQYGEHRFTYIFNSSSY